MKSAVCCLRLGRAGGARRSGREVTHTQSAGEPLAQEGPGRMNKGSQENKQQITAASKVPNWKKTKREQIKLRELRN